MTSWCPIMLNYIIAQRAFIFTWVKENNGFQAGKFWLIHLNIFHWLNKFVQDSAGNSTYFYLGGIPGYDGIITKQQHILDPQGTPGHPHDQMLPGMRSQKCNLSILKTSHSKGAPSKLWISL